ncbi:hypothetical protein OEZ86_009890 [Tetradesmus obliquus]|uniref:Uncharacterized protein n=1 Tax=Tetradesmus obliquus TaxID=3088 RepID=A0ABY8URM2_TETOB|nr:hypothetical protein OEZ85_001327 [Tetradesmus obliquus]WIA43413.1 hypothetical protein OEZ86_009890 [Tetradesmus obliquus]
MALMHRSSTLNISRQQTVSRRTAVRTQALFGWGKKNEEQSYKDYEKEEMFRAQQEMLEARRSGKALDGANQRRRQVAETVAERKAARRAEREALGRGEMPDSLKEWRNYKNKEDETANSGLVVPLLPFGMPKYDAGERFDLRSPYADDGWVDPDETDAWAGFKKIGEKLLNFSGKTKKQEVKPIIWASEYSKYKAQQKSNGKQ